jgi:hypothetical protein
MNIWAYCTLSAHLAVKEATGVEPVTSLPVTADDFNSKQLEGRDLIYFRLHGDPRFLMTWFGEDIHKNHRPAIRHDQILSADLGGAIVVVANCYGEGHPMTEALYDAGASVVIAGGGENYAASNRVIGADLLVRVIITALKAGRSINTALRLAKIRLSATAFRSADRDALAFNIIDKEIMS